MKIDIRYAIIAPLLILALYNPLLWFFIIYFGSGYGGAILYIRTAENLSWKEQILFTALGPIMPSLMIWLFVTEQLRRVKITIEK